MTPQEMDRALAEVMGWELRLVSNCFNTYFSNRECWCSGTEVLYACEDWHPTYDWNQMMQCVEKVSEKKKLVFRLTIAGKHSSAIFYGERKEGKPCSDTIGATKKHPLLAIGEAVLRVAGKWGE